jgi:hypothetical protein
MEKHLFTVRFEGPAGEYTVKSGVAARYFSEVVRLCGAAIETSALPGWMSVSCGATGASARFWVDVHRNYFTLSHYGVLPPEAP